MRRKSGFRRKQIISAKQRVARIKNIKIARAAKKRASMVYDLSSKAKNKNANKVYFNMFMTPGERSQGVRPNKRMGNVIY